MSAMKRSETRRESVRSRPRASRRCSCEARRCARPQRAGRCSQRSPSSQRTWIKETKDKKEQSKAKQSKAKQSKAMQCNSKQSNAMQFKTIQNNSKQCIAKRIWITIAVFDQAVFASKQIQRLARCALRFLGHAVFQHVEQGGLALEQSAIKPLGEGNQRNVVFDQ